jgi:anti-sigma B factor antagonist
MNHPSMALLRPSLCVVEEREIDGVTVLSIGRDLMPPDECPLRDRIDVLVELGRFDVLIDLRHCLDMDSSDIGRLIRAHHSMRKAGGLVRLCNVGSNVTTLLEMTRLNTVLDIHPTEEAALAAVRGIEGGPPAV